MVEKSLLQEWHPG